MQLILGRLKDKENDLKKESQRKQNGNDELVDKIHHTEEDMKKINDEIGQFQLLNVDLPEELKNVENHLIMTQQEKRKLEIEYNKILAENNEKR